MRCLKWGFAIAVGALLLAGCAATPMTGHSLAPLPTVEAVRPAVRDTQIQAFSESVRPIDGEAAAKYELARHFQRLGKHRIAVEMLKEVVQLAPDHAEGYNALGISQDFLKSYADAQRAYLTAILLDPKMDAAYNNLGYSYLLSGNHDQAVAMFQQAIALNGDVDRYHKNLGLAYARTGDTQAAAAALGKVREPGKAAALCERLGLPLPENRAVAGGPSEAAPAAQALGDQTPALAEQPVAGPIDGVEKSRTAAMEKPVAEQTSDQAGTAATAGTPEHQSASTPVSAAVEVSNGNGVRGMAGKVALQLSAKGIAVQRLSNADHYTYARTVIYYRNGYYDAAARLQPLLPGLPGGMAPLEAAGLTREPIRVLLGRDLLQPQPQPVRTATSPGVRPAVDISNGNGARGMAKRVAMHLRQKGFAVGRLENADHFDYPRTIVFYSQGQIESARQLAAAMPDGCPSKLVELANNNARVQVILGADMVF